MVKIYPFIQLPNDLFKYKISISFSYSKTFLNVFNCQIINLICCINGYKKIPFKKNLTKLVREINLNCKMLRTKFKLIKLLYLNYPFKILKKKKKTIVK